MKGPLNYWSYVNVTMKPSFSWYHDVSVAVKLRSLTKLRFALLSVTPLIIRVKLYTWWALFWSPWQLSCSYVNITHDLGFLLALVETLTSVTVETSWIDVISIKKLWLALFIGRYRHLIVDYIWISLFFLRRENSVHMMMLRVDKKSLLGINFLFSKEITWFISSRNHMHSNTG